MGQVGEVEEDGRADEVGEDVKGLECLPGKGCLDKLADHSADEEREEKRQNQRCLPDVPHSSSRSFWCFNDKVYEKSCETHAEKMQGFIVHRQLWKRRHTEYT